MVSCAIADPFCRGRASGKSPVNALGSTDDPAADANSNVIPAIAKATTDDWRS